MNTISLRQASTMLPSYVWSKVQQIAHENEIETIAIVPQKSVSPTWDRVVSLPAYARAWVFSGGSYWLLCSDGQLYVEPAELPEHSAAQVVADERKVWIVSLDDEASYVRVEQFLPTLPAQPAVPQSGMSTAQPVEVELSWCDLDFSARGRASVIAQTGVEAASRLRAIIENITCDDLDVPAFEMRLDDSWEG